MSKSFLQRFQNRMQKINKKGEIEINKESFINPIINLPQLHRKTSSGEELVISKNNSLQSYNIAVGNLCLPRFLTPARPMKFVKEVKTSGYKLRKLIKNCDGAVREQKLTRKDFCRYKTPQKLGKVKELLKYGYI